MSTYIFSFSDQGNDYEFTFSQKTNNLESLNGLSEESAKKLEGLSRLLASQGRPSASRAIKEVEEREIKEVEEREIFPIISRGALACGFDNTSLRKTQDISILSLSRSSSQTSLSSSKGQIGRAHV